MPNFISRWLFRAGIALILVGTVGEFFGNADAGLSLTVTGILLLIMDLYERVNWR